MNQLKARTLRQISADFRTLPKVLLPRRTGTREYWIVELMRHTVHQIPRTGDTGALRQSPTLFGLLAFQISLTMK